MLPQKNFEMIEDYLKALIDQAEIDLAEIIKEITEQKKIEFFKINQEIFESQF